MGKGEMKGLLSVLSDKLGRRLKPGEIGFLGKLFKSYGPEIIFEAIESLNRSASDPIKILAWYCKENGSKLSEVVDRDIYKEFFGNAKPGPE
jgi:hypothetical protein